ncbi:MAG TPA: penicillin-binding protein activator [Novosphingobium sp.]|nr:penicillin-binding protein activator [Novosphingobium sp.]
MIERILSRRKVIAAGVLALLAGCTVVPKAPKPEGPPPPVAGPSDVLPTDAARHRIALLVPMSGANAGVGQSIANAATMALLDTNAQNLRVTTYDTSAGTQGAAQRAVADGNTLILGPLLASDITVVAGVARPAGVPLISFSNDATAATRDVFVMGNLPGQSVARTVAFARTRGVRTFSALVPRGEYGQQASDALMQAAQRGGGGVVSMEAYDRSNSSIASAARRIQEKGGSGAILIADGGRMAARAAPLLKAGADQPRLIGTELWSGERDVTASKALEGAWFAAVSDNRFNQFSQSYRKRFGATPYRIATLGYDAVLLTLRIAQGWKPGTAFPLARLVDKSGFLGLDGAFRFGRDGVIERALEVREVRAGGLTTVSPAPTTFGD